MLGLHSSNKLIKNIWQLYRPFKKEIALTIVCVVSSSAITLLNPILNRKMIDEGIVGMDYKRFLEMLTLITMLFIFSQTYSSLKQRRTIIWFADI